MDKTYSSSDVASLTGASLRQLQWWAERMVVTPFFEGHDRRYTERQLTEVTLVASLRKKKISLQKIRRVLAKMRLELTRQPTHVLVEYSASPFSIRASAAYTEGDALRQAIASKSPVAIVPLTRAA